MRIFIAVQFSEPARKSVIDCMDSLRRQGVRGNYTRPENLHLTMAFIGETDQPEKIKTAVRGTRFEPFEIRLADFGAFRDILWLGVTGEKRLREVSDRLRESLTRQGISFDRKPFKAHITLVRKASMPGKPRLAPPETAMTVSRLSVMKSERIGGKLVYTEV